MSLFLPFGNLMQMLAGRLSLAILEGRIVPVCPYGTCWSVPWAMNDSWNIISRLLDSCWGPPGETTLIGRCYNKLICAHPV